MLQSDLSGISSWSDRWLVTFAPEETKSMIISNIQDCETNRPIFFKDVQIEDVQSQPFLGLIFTSQLSWSKHIDNIEQKARMKLNMMQPSKFSLDRRSLETIFTSFVMPTVFYGIEVWGGFYQTHLNKLGQVIIDGMRILTGATALSNV